MIRSSISSNVEGRCPLSPQRKFPPPNRDRHRPAAPFRWPPVSESAQGDFGDHNKVTLAGRHQPSQVVAPPFLIVAAAPVQRTSRWGRQFSPSTQSAVTPYLKTRGPPAATVRQSANANWQDRRIEKPFSSTARCSRSGNHPRLHHREQIRFVDGKDAIHPGEGENNAAGGMAPPERPVPAPGDRRTPVLIRQRKTAAISPALCGNNTSSGRRDKKYVT